MKMFLTVVVGLAITAGLVAHVFGPKESIFLGTIAWLLIHQDKPPRLGVGR